MASLSHDDHATQIGSGSAAPVRQNNDMCAAFASNSAADERVPRQSEEIYNDNTNAT